MRVRGVGIGGAFLCGVTVMAFVQRPDAMAVLAAARDALGGEAKLAAVRTFVATGRTRQIRGNNLVPIEFEIDCELPDKYVRKDEIPAQDTGIAVAGFRGDELVQSSGRGGAPADAAASKQRVALLKQDFARLALGAFASSFPSFPLTFTYAAEAQAPEGTADVLAVAGPANFTARLLVQRDTHLPVMLIWQMAGGAGRGPGRGAGSPPGPPPAPSSESPRGGEPSAAAGSPAPRGGPPPSASAEHRLYYADYRPVGDGIKWPFRIRHAVAGETIEETTFDRVSLNVKIDPRKFEVPK